MSVTLRKKANSDGSTSLYLDIYENKKRYKEYLKDCKLTKASTPLDRKKNSDNLALAKNIAVKRAQELVSKGYDVVASYRKEVDLIEYFDDYLIRYSKKDLRNMKGACNQFKLFMKDKGINNLTVQQLSEKIVIQYVDFLENKCTGEGAYSYYARFKKIIKQIVRDYRIVNPTSDVTIVKEDSIVKDVLTIDEIKILAGTTIFNTQVKNAFLFCCFTGLDWIDTKNLKWKHIDLRNSILTKVREKSGEEARVSLNKTAISYLPEQGENDEFIFTLPSHTGALKTLKNWLEKAKIQNTMLTSSRPYIF